MSDNSYNGKYPYNPDDFEYELKDDIKLAYDVIEGVVTNRDINGVVANIMFDLKDAYSFHEIDLDTYSEMKEYFWGLVFDAQENP